MSTETTNKKIKIDNGTTFGRTYTDKAVDELLKNAGGGVGVIELTDSQFEQLEQMKITFTSEQIANIKNSNSLIMTYNNKEVFKGSIYHFTKSEFSAYQIFGMFGIIFICISFTPDTETQVQDIITYSIPSIFDLKYDGDSFYLYNREGGYSSNRLYFDFINGQPIMHAGNHVTDYHLTNDKTISLFGTHSILVPKDSADTNILPCTTADNGKVLSVVNGEAQWASAGGGTEIKSTNIYFEYKQKMKDWEVGDADYLDSELVQITPVNTKTVWYLPYYVSQVIKPDGSDTATLLITYEATNESSGYVKGRINIVCLKAGSSSLDLVLTQKRLYTE